FARELAVTGERRGSSCRLRVRRCCERLLETPVLVLRTCLLGIGATNRSAFAPPPWRWHRVLRVAYSPWSLAGEAVVSLSSAHDGGGEPLVPDCRVRVVFRLTNDAVAESWLVRGYRDARDRVISTFADNGDLNIAMAPGRLMLTMISRGTAPFAPPRQRTT
ncbi:hypothetical protein DMN91_000435, partial [Ooceraea biroi]